MDNVAAAAGDGVPNLSDALIILSARPVNLDSANPILRVQYVMDLGGARPAAANTEV